MHMALRSMPAWQQNKGKIQNFSTKNAKKKNSIAAPFCPHFCCYLSQRFHLQFIQHHEREKGGMGVLDTWLCHPPLRWNHVFKFSTHSVSQIDVQKPNGQLGCLKIIGEIRNSWMLLSLIFRNELFGLIFYWQDKECFMPWSQTIVFTWGEYYEICEGVKAIQTQVLTGKELSEFICSADRFASCATVLCSAAARSVYARHSQTERKYMTTTNDGNWVEEVRKCSICSQDIKQPEKTFAEMGGKHCLSFCGCPFCGC